MEDSTAPVILALLSAVLFAMGTQFINLGLRHGDPQSGTLVDIGATMVFYWVLAPFFMEWDYWLTGTAILFASLGLIRPFISANLAARAVYYLGPTLSSTLSSTTPLFAAVFAFALLGEEPTLMIALGTGGIVAALVVQASPGGLKRNWPLWALLFPLGASFIRAGSHAATKLGLETVPSPLFASLAAYSVSFLVALSAQKFCTTPMPNLFNNKGMWWFAAAGIFNGMAVLSMNIAFLLGKLIVVTPIVASYPFFTLLLSVAVFRRERLTPRTILAVFLVVPGVLLIALGRN
jgi:drug/metabolite transporter (DMT)-like permease